MRLLLLMVAFAGLWAGPGRADDIRFYQPATASAPETLFGIDAQGLTGQIERALIQDTGFANLRSFSVHWERPTFRCLVKSHELYEAQHGVCLVEIGAFQVAATALIVKRGQENAFDVSILDAMIE
ncbi:hypothetical protein [Mesorhizobium sp. A556]